MPKLRALSGEEVIKIFGLFGFLVVAQRGSHAKLARVLRGGIRQTLTVPKHNEMDKGTLKAIYRQSLRYILETELKPHFYTE